MSSKKERYQEYLKSGEWKHKKSQKLKQANFKCDGCNESKGAMEVHHLTYDRIGMELFTDLAVYCHECHQVAHKLSTQTEWNKYLTLEADIKPVEKSKEDIKMEKIINAI